MNERGTTLGSAFALEDASAFLRELVQGQAELVLSGWARAKPFIRKDSRDFATEIDIEVERNLKRALRERFPTHTYDGEETGSEGGSSPYRWLIDPIDGTKYYAADAHLFSISVALLHEEVPILGVVYVPTSGQCFHAMAGRGAFLGEKRLRGPSATSLDAAIINLDISRTDTLGEAERHWFETKLVALTRVVYRVRALGAGALASCWLATGALDAYMDLTGYSKPPDVAAGRLIMAESGAQVGYLTPPSGPPRLVAAAPALWTELERLLA